MSNIRAGYSFEKPRLYVLAIQNWDSFLLQLRCKQIASKWTIGNIPRSKNFFQRFVAPFLRNPPNRRFLVQLRSLLPGWAQLAVGADASGKEVVHQPRLDLLVFFNQGLGSLDGFIDYL